MQYGAPQPKRGLYKNRVDDFEKFQDITEPVLYKGLRRKAVVNIAYEKNKGPVFNLAKIEPALWADLISGLSRFYRPLPRAGNSPGLQGLMNSIANMPYKINRGVYKGLYPAFGQTSARFGQGLSGENSIYSSFTPANEDVKIEPAPRAGNSQGWHYRRGRNF